MYICPVKTSITRFTLLSATIVTLLGCFRGDSHGAYSSRMMQPPVEVNVESIVDVAMNAGPKMDEQQRKEKELHLNFPNVFDIFRYLF